MRTAVCVIFACALLHAQAPARTRFEVASVKAAGPRAAGGGFRGGPGSSDPGQVSYIDFDLHSLVLRAYDVRPYQLTAAPWMAEARFDIVAKVPAGATAADLRVMLQNLLVERFGLKVRRESKVADAYLLTVGKNGSKMPAYPLALPEDFLEIAPKGLSLDKDGFVAIPAGYATGIRIALNGQTQIAIARQPITALCGFLSRILHGPVVDQTEMAGRYDVRLRFVADDTAAPAADASAVPTASDPAPTLFRALENELGLKLEPKRMPIDFLVVESASRTPTEN